jgi:hypothetical protein
MLIRKIKKIKKNQIYKNKKEVEGSSLEPKGTKQ